MSLRDEIERNPIIDGHEHLLLPREARELRLHLPRFLWDCYVQYDLLSAGLPREEWERLSGDCEEAWALIYPHLNKIQNTAYFRALLRAFKDLYGFNSSSFDEGDWRELSQCMEQMNRGEGWYDLVLKEKAGIEVALLSRDILEVGYRLFRPVISLDDFLEGYNDVVLFKSLSPYKVNGGEICERGRLVLEKRGVLRLVASMSIFPC